MTPTYIIGEIGQNHNGSVELAKLLIDNISLTVKEERFGLTFKGMNAIKLTKRDLDYELSTSQMNMPYPSPHSFGKTYGEHRKALELTYEQHQEIFFYAKSFQLDVVETLCAISCLKTLDFFRPDYLKIASRDITNLPLIEALAETKIPIIVSTGMTSEKELDTAIAIITKKHEHISILHCTSQYPTEPKHVNLNTIPYLKKKYPDYSIGFSDHTIGISIPVAAVAMGAQIIEKHITLDRRMKGTDHIGSLGPEGQFRMVRDIRLLEASMGVEALSMKEGAEENKKKLARSIASNRQIEKGELITLDDIHLLSPGDGIAWHNKEHILGKSATATIKKNEIIYPHLFE